MALILTIETSTTVCSVAIHDKGKLLAIKESDVPNSHSELLAPYIKALSEEIGRPLEDFDAICFSMGPGSYTGLRIGASTAKGLCFAFDIPLIAINTLEGLAQGIILNSKYKIEDAKLLCPMLDARRMEVYYALFDNSGKCIEETAPKIIDEFSFQETIKAQNVLFFGNGAEKCKTVLKLQNAEFLDDIHPSAANFGEIAYDKYKKKAFEDAAYFEPFYLKEFYTVPSKKAKL